MSKKVIAIAGLGWLGEPLARHLEFSGFKVKGSVTSQKKADALKAKGLDASPLLITESGTTGAPLTLLAGADILIVMIPPGLRNNAGANYALKMAHFVNDIERYEVPQVILVSSTSVYDDDQGMVTELDRPKPQSNAGKQLVEVEQLFFNASTFVGTIVRFGGLFGGSRNPVKFLAGRKGLSNGKAPVNLIHRDDCIGIIKAILKKEAFGHIFNAVIPKHPNKSDYYTKLAIAEGLEPPQYDDTPIEETYKQVDSVHVHEILDYDFKNEL